MQKSSLIGHTIELYDAIRSTAQPADGVVREFFRSRHYLGSKDRRFISEAIFGMLRNFRLIEVIGAETLRQCAGTMPPSIPAIVDYAVYATRILNEDAASMQSGVAGLWRVYVPGVECGAALEAMGSIDPVLAMTSDPVAFLGVTHSMPDEIVKEWLDQYGRVEAEQLCIALNNPAPTTIRVNTLRASLEECQRSLTGEGVASVRTLLSPVGLRLEKRININAHPSFKQGHFEMQDEGSQLLSMLVEPRPGQTIVDACAGGGGKTLHLASLLHDTGSLIALDTDEKRLNNIRPRLQRAGVTCVRLLNAAETDSIRSLHGQADAVLIDAPCTGVGIFRRNPGGKRTFTSAFVERVAKTQRDVLESYCAIVRPGGRLVYSTCTLMKQENEHQVERFLRDHTEFALTSASDTLANQGVPVERGSPYLTLLPHKTSTDGFFAAVFTRSA